MRRACLTFLWLCCLLSPSAPRAETYADDLAFEDEAELRALYEEGRLPEQDFETLRELLRTGLDPRTASREALFTLPGFTWAQVDALLAYRERARADWRPEDLVEAGVLTEEGLRRVRPFLQALDRSAEDVSGRLRLLSAQGVGETQVPPMLLLAQVKGPWGLRGGVGLSLTRRRLGPARYDPRRGTLVAELPTVALQVPKLHVRWEGAHASVLVGTYRVGFGQRLTLDTTGRPAPDGFVADEGFVFPTGSERRCVLTGAGACPDEDVQARSTPDFGWTEGFRGVAGTVRGRVEDVTLSFTGFGSYQSRALSQYELFDRGRCVPAKDARECEAPDVLAVLPGQRVPGAARFVSRALPEVFHELAVGGHASVASTSRARVGLTAWGAWPQWAVAGATLDFREGARYPGGGGYGALGVEGAWGLGPVNLFVEGARSFAGSSAPGGGFGVLQRTVLGDRRQEWELALRYYGQDFDNPYSRAPASPDEVGGLRARDELGGGLRYVHRTKGGAWQWAGEVDVWTPPSRGVVSGPVHLRTSARVGFLGVPGWWPSVWGEHHNKQLGRDGPGRCFEGDEGTLPEGGTAPCSGERYLVAGRVRWEASEALSLAGQYTHVWMGSRQWPEGYAQQGRGTVEALLRPLPPLRVHGRAGWQDEVLSNDTRRMRAVRTSMEVAWALLPELGTRARYELSLELAASEGGRTPAGSPRHLFRLELEGRL